MGKLGQTSDFSLVIREVPEVPALSSPPKRQGLKPINRRLTVRKRSRQQMQTTLMGD